MAPSSLERGQTWPRRGVAGTAQVVRDNKIMIISSPFVIILSADEQRSS